MRNLTKALATLGVGTALALAPTAANAHATYVYHGADYAYVYGGHHDVFAYDKECDGNPVRAQVHTYAEFLPFTVRDSNGCDPGAGSLHTKYYIWEVRVCELKNDGLWWCSKWADVRQ